MRINNRAQEEAVGFVAIIVIVAIAMVFFIGLTLRDDEPTGTKSIEINQFLESADRYTTDCQISLSDKYADLGELGIECYRNAYFTCFDGRLVCEVYNETIKNLINSSFAIGEGYVVKGYEFNLSYMSQNNQHSVYNQRVGDCSNNYKSEELMKSDGPGKGTFVSALKLCF